MDAFVIAMSRGQFALTAITHFTFVTTTVGLLIATFIFEMIYAFGKGRNPLSQNDHYGRLALFFGKLCIFSYGTGVVTGLVMQLQFGMNWSAYSAFFGDVIGVPFALEGLIAFFLESVLFGLWRFTWGKVGKKKHTIFGAGLLATSIFSVLWIISINAFMQNPYGYYMEGSRARLTSVISLFENPQYAPEVTHVLFAIMIVGGFLVAGISAWQILRKRNVELFKKAVQIGLLIALPAAIIQPIMGDDQGVATAQLQPMKFAAIEGRYYTNGSDEEGSPWTIIGWADTEAKRMYGIDIPELGSYFAGGSFKGSNPGMTEIAEQYHEKYDNTAAASYGGTMDYYPPVNLLFWGLRAMVFTGYYFAIFGMIAMILLHRRKKSIEEHPKTLKALGITMWFPYAAFVGGWVIAEVGRFPFVVYGLLTYLDAVSPSMTAANITASFTMFAVLDALLIVTMIVISHRVMKRGVPDINDNYPDKETNQDFFGREVQT